MGIKGLNQYFKKNASPRSIQNISVSYLRNKTLVVDTSIYIYKFLEDGMLLENMYTFITQCIEQEITLLFVFDNKPSDMKKDICTKRYNYKLLANEKYHELKEILESKEMDDKEKYIITQKMNDYKKKSIRIKPHYFDQLKNLMDALGVFWCDAPEESDVVCAYFVRKGIAWACISDDMDMFAYGCERVLREWNIQKSSVVLYDLDLLKKDIKIENENSSQLFILAGNDYTKKEKIPFDTIIEWYGQYIHSAATSFYEWLVLKEYISNDKKKQLEEIIPLYEVPESIVLNKKIPTSRSMIQWEKLQSILSPYGFVFIV